MEYMKMMRMIDIQLVSYASVTYFNSSPCIVGDDNQILFSNGVIIVFTFLIKI